MARITVEVPDEQRDALKRLAEKEAVSLPELVRRVLKRVVEEEGKPSEEELWERAFSVAGKYASGVPDLGERHDDYVSEAYGE